jgi:hypothetical protein
VLDCRFRDVNAVGPSRRLKTRRCVDRVAKEIVQGAFEAHNTTRHGTEMQPDAHAKVPAKKLIVVDFTMTVAFVVPRVAVAGRLMIGIDGNLEWRRYNTFCRFIIHRARPGREPIDPGQSGTPAKLLRAAAAATAADANNDTTRTAAAAAAVRRARCWRVKRWRAGARMR